MYRHGQWVKFHGALSGAFKAKDGRTVGVFHRARTDPFGHPVQAQVIPVSEDGQTGLSTLVNGILTFTSFVPEALHEIGRASCRERV